MTDHDFDVEKATSRRESNVCVASLGTQRTPTVPSEIAIGDQSIISGVDNTLPLYGISHSELLPTSDYDKDYNGAVINLVNPEELHGTSTNVKNKIDTLAGSSRSHRKDKQKSRANRSTRKLARRTLILKLGIFVVAIISIAIIAAAVLVYEINVKQLNQLKPPAELENSNDTDIGLTSEDFGT